MLALTGYTIWAQKTGGSQTADIYTINGDLSRTINIAFTFDAPKEGGWGHTLSSARR